MSGCEIKSQRSEPAAWPALLEVAETAVPQPGQQEWGDSEEMRLLYEALQEFSMDDLSEVGFYAHGLVICEVAKALRDPAARERIVERGAEALIDTSEKLAGGVSAIPTKPEYLHTAYADLIRGAYDQRPVPEHLVGEMAHSIRLGREDSIESELWVPHGLRDKQYAGLVEGVLGRLNREQAVTDVTLIAFPEIMELTVEGEEKAPKGENIVRGNIVLSAAYIAALAVRDVAPEVIGGVLPRQDFIDILRARRTKQAALEACGVRSDEFFDQKNPIIQFIDGQAVFNDPLDRHGRPKLSKSRQYYERDEALVCPAADVRGMVPLSLDLVGRIVETATERLSQAGTIS